MDVYLINKETFISSVFVMTEFMMLLLYKMKKPVNEERMKDAKFTTIPALLTRSVN